MVKAVDPGTFTTEWDGCVLVDHTIGGVTYHYTVTFDRKGEFRGCCLTGNTGGKKTDPTYSFTDQDWAAPQNVLKVATDRWNKENRR